MHIILSDRNIYMHTYGIKGNHIKRQIWEILETQKSYMHIHIQKVNLT